MCVVLATSEPGTCLRSSPSSQRRRRRVRGRVVERRWRRPREASRAPFPAPWRRTSRSARRPQVAAAVVMVAEATARWYSASRCRRHNRGASEPPSAASSACLAAWLLLVVLATVSTVSVVASAVPTRPRTSRRRPRRLRPKTPRRAAWPRRRSAGTRSDGCVRTSRDSVA